MVMWVDGVIVHPPVVVCLNSHKVIWLFLNVLMFALCMYVNYSCLSVVGCISRVQSRIRPLCRLYHGIGPPATGGPHDQLPIFYHAFLMSER